VINRRHCASTALILSCIWTASAYAQGGGGAPAIPSSAYDNPTGERDKINAFISYYVNNLVNDADPPAQSKARDALVNALYTKGAPAQPPFMFEYGRALETALSAKIAPNLKPTLRQRLNVAIVAARSAALLGNYTLAPTVVKLINDNSEPIVLWGMKAAGPIVPALMAVQGNANKPPELLAAIGPAVLKHPTGEIFDEAYAALSFSHKMVFDELIKLWDNRLTQYEKGIPEDPSVDSRAVFATTKDDMWKNVVKNKDDREKVMQMVSDQLSAAAPRADEVGPGNESWEQLVQVVARSSAGCVVVGTRESIPAMATAADALSKIKPDAVKGQKLKPLVDPVLAQIRSAFTGVKAPQPLKQIGAIAQP
jgi:hypothetical protein